jgi:calmodulin
MSRADHAEIREIFDFYDTDGNGTIDREEFAHLCRALDAGFTDAEVAIGLEAVDGNHNGVIEFREFAAWWRDRG